jgi:hypothetical protein
MILNVSKVIIMGYLLFSMPEASEDFAYTQSMYWHQNQRYKLPNTSINKGVSWSWNG